MATTINVNALPEYVEQNRDELIVKASTGFKTLDYVDLMLGVKHKEAFNYLDSEVVLQDGSDCGWNPQGSETFSQRYIEVHPVEVEKEICWKVFKEKYMNHQLLWEAGRETLPFENKIIDSNIAAIQEAMEDLVWQGNSALTIDGFLAEAENVSATTVNFETGATAVGKVDAIVAALPVKMLKQGVNIFMSYTDFRSYIQESNGTCCANRPIIDAAVETLSYLGDSRVTLVPVMGLEGTGEMLAATKRALVYATDIEGSESTMRVWFDEKNEEFDFRTLFVANVGIKYIDEVVLAK
jgi:hypothetical protein